MTARRFPALVVIPALMVAAILIDRRDDGPNTVTPEDDVVVEAPQDPAMPVVAASSDQSATWYCAAGTGGGNGIVARQYLFFANTSDEPRLAHVSAFGSEGTTKSQEIQLEPHSRGALDVASLVSSPYVSSLVELDGGGVAVSELVQGPLGLDITSCQSGASPTWYFPATTTTVDAASVLVVFNPFPDDAILDVTFETDSGRRAPEAFEGLVVPGRSVVAFDVTPVITRRDQFSTTVQARAGQVVVDRLQTYDGTVGPKGLTVSGGAPTPAETWIFPEGQSGEGISERFVVFNPSDEPAEVDLEIVLDDPTTNGSVEPIPLTVPRRSYVVVTTTDPAWQAVPPGISHSVVVRSLNGIPVVAERTMSMVAPFAYPGVASTLGAPLTATRLVVAAGGLEGVDASGVSLLNPSTQTIARVEITAYVDGEAIELEPIELGEGSRASFLVSDQLGDDFASAILVFEATEPIAADQGFGWAEGTGLGLIVAVPVEGTVAVPTGG